MLQQYKHATSIALMGLWEWDIRSNDVKWSDEKYALFGYEPNEFEVNLETAFNTVHPEDVSLISTELEKNLPNQNYFDYSYRGIKKDGDIIHVWVRVNVERNKNGEPIKVLGVSQDRTREIQLEQEIIELNKQLEEKVEQRTAELQKKINENEMLFKEIHHRVKNNLQVISSILNLQKGYLKDSETTDILDLCVKRIRSMAMIHESLYQKRNVSEIDVGKYLNKMVALYNDGRDISFQIDVNGPSLGLDFMVPTGLIINELVANSFKHGFKESDSGDISICLNVGKTLEMNYRDNGKGMDLSIFKDSHNSSFGIEMIKTLIRGLEGQFQFKSEPGKGMEFSFEAPLDENQ